MTHEMNNDFSTRYGALRAAADRVLNALEAHALSKYGRDFFRVARICFPGRSADGTVRHGELFLPWAVFSWSPHVESRKLLGGDGASLPTGPLALEWLEEKAEDGDALAERFAAAATRTLFRFLRLENLSGGIATLEDMLDPGTMLTMSADEIPEGPRPGDMIFCHAVTVDGITVGTHPPLDASECTRDAAGRSRFEALLGLMAGELRASGLQRDGHGRRMLENLLFMHARYCTGAVTLHDDQ